MFLRAVFDPSGMLPGSGTLAQFTAAVNALSASGGGDCPEFGMDGLLLALDQISGLPPLAASLSQIILVTDASSLNDNLFTDVITEANTLGVIIHGLLTRTGCGVNFGNFPTVISATGGIEVNNLPDFGIITNFVQATLVSGGFGGDAMFGLALSSHTITVSKFATVLQVLIRTSEPQVTITRPSGTTEVLSVTGTLAFFEDEDPESGDWMFSVASGTLEIAVNSPILLDFFVSHIIDDPDSDGILPVCEPPQCKCNYYYAKHELKVLHLHLLYRLISFYRLFLLQAVQIWSWKELGYMHITVPKFLTCTKKYAACALRMISKHA